MKKVLFVSALIILSALTVYAQEVNITVKGAKIYGTLVVPESASPVSVVLFIAGSGPTDRDGNNYLIKGKNNAYKMIAEALSANGIASLRYDKRSIGKSDKTKEADLTFDMYIDDAVEWIKFLKQDKRFDKIIVAGHSEGSLIGMNASLIAGADKYVSISGAGRPIDVIVLKQTADQEAPQDIMDEMKASFDSLKLGRKPGKINQALASFFRPSIIPYMISWIKHNPCEEIARLKIPVLIIQGDNDIQVAVEDAELLYKAAPGSTRFIIPDMTHMLKSTKARDRESNILTYGDPDLPVSPELIKKLAEFIKK